MHWILLYQIYHSYISNDTNSAISISGSISGAMGPERAGCNLPVRWTDPPMVLKSRYQPEEMKNRLNFKLYKFSLV